MNKGTIHPRRGVKLREGCRRIRETFISCPKIVLHRFQKDSFVGLVWFWGFFEVFFGWLVFSLFLFLFFQSLQCRKNL